MTFLKHMRTAFANIRRRIADAGAASLFALGMLAAACGPAWATDWRPDHTVIVVLENRSASQVIGSPEAPCLNALAASGALFTNAYAATTPYATITPGDTTQLAARPSQPNYLYLFSGSNQGVLPEWFQSPGSPYTGTASHDAQGKALPAPLGGVPVGVGNGLVPAAWRPFTTPNLGAAIRAAGASYASFSESLPYPAYDGERDLLPLVDRYRRKHNPTVNWINLHQAAVPPARQRFVLPVDSNLGFLNTQDPTSGQKYRGFAVDADGRSIGFEQLPTVSLVVPNEQNDAHSASLAAADAWLAQHIQPYADWARTHNSLLIVTFDEDGGPKIGPPQPIVTVFVGPGQHVAAGRYAQTIDHLNVLATVLQQYGALEAFGRDFQAAFDTPQAARAHANLQPLTAVISPSGKAGSAP